MKKLFIAAYAALLVCACGPVNEPVITNGDLKISINRSMHFKVESTAEGAEAYYSNYAPSDQLIADEATISDWKLNEWKEEETAEGKTYTLCGSWEKNGYNIEKTLTIVVPNDFQNMVLVNSSYVNNSDKILTVKGNRVKQGKGRF